MKRLALVFAGLFIAACILTTQASHAQQANTGQSQIPVIKVNAEEVNLDMVFHDKKGKTIRDIRPEEVHVQEDGTDQQIESFKLVNGTNAEAVGTEPGQKAGSLTPDPMRELRLVTLVFENLDQDGKRFFRSALDDILKLAPEQNLYFSVMVIDQKLNMIQQFTSDRSQLMKSVDKAAMWTYIDEAKNSAQIKEQLRISLTGGESGGQSDASGDAQISPVLTAGNQSGPSASAINGSVAWRMNKMQYDMLQQADAADRETDARGTIDALLSLVQAQSQLPGRKVVLYFNPWLNIPEVAKEQYNHMIGMANRANITFYTVDPKGLITWNQDSGGTSALSGAAATIRNKQMNHGVGEVTTDEARVDENEEAGMRSNPLMWLRDLAQQTGGSTIAETNDLRAPLRVVMDDVESYYEATYNPHISVFDGKFRKILVRVDRPGIEVHTRSGYFALPHTASGEQLAPFEMPLLNAIGAATPATDLGFKAAAVKFNQHGPKVEYMLTLEVPLSELTFEPQADGKNATVDAPWIAVIRNPAGDIVAKYSKEFAAQVPVANVDAFKKTNLVQTHQIFLAPGTYSLETAVMDKKNNKLGVNKSSLTVPDPTAKVSISDISLVSIAEPVKNNQVLDPFYFQGSGGNPGGKIVPTLNPTIKGGAGSVISLYFAVYVDPSVKDAPTLTMSFTKDGQSLGALPVQLPPAQDGRIPYIANLPADKFPLGSYEITLTATQGAGTAEQKVTFQLQ